ncbi:MAG: hypothetical protein HY428_02320 [Candidatus Levybacteria bacterium]|nr:hypothetical protein [Candidatus Levybacteria bacterium]
MIDQATTTVKKTTRTRKTTATPTVVSEAAVSTKAVTALEDVFNNVIQRINDSKAEFVSMQRLIEETKQAWIREQREHELQVAQQNQQEEVERRREQESYEYETKLARRKAEDEFLQRKTKWERELEERKDEIERERQELVTLRRQVEGFEGDKEKAIKDATTTMQKEVANQFATEKKLREQEVKAEKELLALKITTLTQENTRLNNEVEALKKALTDATVQLKDVAVKVIESSNTSSKQFTGSTE